MPGAFFYILRLHTIPFTNRFPNLILMNKPKGKG
jgi:hypothetical protein